MQILKFITYPAETRALNKLRNNHYFEQQNLLVSVNGIRHYSNSIPPECRSQWLRGLRYEMSSLALSVGSWVLIPLKVWMFAFILCCLVGSGLATADHLSKESYRLYKIKKLKRKQSVLLMPYVPSGSNRKDI
jgi:hypothetical protein